MLSRRVHRLRVGCLPPTLYLWFLPFPFYVKDNVSIPTNIPCSDQHLGWNSQVLPPLKSTTSIWQKDQSGSNECFLLVQG